MGSRFSTIIINFRSSFALFRLKVFEKNILFKIYLNFANNRNSTGEGKQCVSLSIIRLQCVVSDGPVVASSFVEWPRVIISINLFCLTNQVVKYSEAVSNVYSFFFK